MTLAPQGGAYSSPQGVPPRLRLLRQGAAPPDPCEGLRPSPGRARPPGPPPLAFHEGKLKKFGGKAWGG